MKLSHKEFTRAKTIPQLPIYLIHGSPRHLQNEIERKICSHYKGSNFSEKKNFIVDTNFNLEELRNELELISNLNLMISMDSANGHLRISFFSLKLLVYLNGEKSFSFPSLNI